MSVAALFSALSPDERRFMLAPPGAVEPGLSPAALAAAAVWTTRETGSVATLEALCPGGAFIPSPGDLPGEACNIDMSHLLVPFSKHDGRIIGHASSVTRLFCTPGSRTTGSSWQPPVIDGGGALLPADSGPGALAMNGRFMYDEDARHLLLRTTIGGNPAWFGYAFAIRLDAGTSGEGADSAAEGTSGASSWEEARAEAATRGKCATDAIVEVARRCGLGTPDRVRSVTMYHPGAELSAEGILKHVMMGDERMPSRGGWAVEFAEGGRALVDDTWAECDGYDNFTAASSQAAASSRRSYRVRPSDSSGNGSSASSDSSSSTGVASVGSSMSIVSADGPTSGNGAPRPPQWRTSSRAGGPFFASSPPRRSRRPRTSGMDFSNFATSLSANVNGVYRHCMPPSWPGDLSTYFGSEGVVPAMAVLPLFGAYGGNAAVVGSADWGVAGGGVARLDALQTALSSLTLTTTPLVRDAERLLLLPQPADDRGVGWQGVGGGAPLPRGTSTAPPVAARRRRTAAFSATSAGGLSAAVGAAEAAAQGDADADAASAATTTSGASGSVPSSAAVAPFVALFDADKGIDDGKGNDDDGSQLSVPSAEAVKEFTSLF